MPTQAEKHMIFPWLSRVEDGTFFDQYRMTARAVQQHNASTGQKDDFASVLVRTDERVRKAVGGDVQTLSNMLAANVDGLRDDLDPDVYYWAVSLNDAHVSRYAHTNACDSSYRRLTPKDVYGE